jgi:FkbM family methyltransferase
MLEKFLNKYVKEGTNIAQVGAHFGQELEPIIKSGFKEIYLFEPIKSNVDELYKKTKSIKNIEIFPIALGNKNTQTKIYISGNNDGQSSSLLQPELHLELQPNITFKQEALIDLKRFEDLNLTVNFLIIDAQGYELEVLKGFGKKLENVDYIFTEVNRDYLYKNNVLIKDLDTFLIKKSFVRIWTKWRIANMPWGDAFYMRINPNDKFKIKMYLFKNYLLTNKISFLIYYVLDIRILRNKLKNKIRKTSYLFGFCFLIR